MDHLLGAPAGGGPPRGTDRVSAKTAGVSAREREGAAAPSHKQGGSGGAAGPPSGLNFMGVPPHRPPHTYALFQGGDPPPCVGG